MLILFHRRSKNKRHPDQRYHDRPQANVLITGASSGIGKATALYLAERGYTVIATSRDASRLDGLHADADTLGMSVIGVELDINSDDAVSCIVPQLIERYGAMDALVNNAGLRNVGPCGNPVGRGIEKPVRDELLRRRADDSGGSAGR